MTNAIKKAQASPPVKETGARVFAVRPPLYYGAPFGGGIFLDRALPLDIPGRPTTARCHATGFEGAHSGGGGHSFGDALWWSANLGLSGNPVVEPSSFLGRVLSITLTAYAVVVFASLAGAVGAYFVEARA